MTEAMTEHGDEGGVAVDGVLIVRLSALGDTLLTIPLLQRLREAHPHLTIGWLVGEAAAPILEGFPEIDHLHVLPKADRGLGGLWRVAQRIRRHWYDVSLDAQGLTKSALVPWLAGIPWRLGLARAPLDARELAPWLNNELVRVPPHARHVTARMLQLLAPLGIAPGPDAPGRLLVEKGAWERMRAWWREQALPERTLILGPGAGWPTKRLPASALGGVAQAARADGWRVVVLWGPGEADLLPAWRAALGPETLWAPPTDMREMLALLSLCRRYAGSDSAALHGAWLLGKPTFSWFGASDPARCAPRGAAHAHVAMGPHDWRRKGVEIAVPDPTTLVERFCAWLRAEPVAGARGVIRLWDEDGPDPDTTLDSGMLTP